MNNSTLPIDALDSRLLELTTNQVKVEIMRLVAQVNDGHTRARQETTGNHMLPIRLRYFSDGLYVEAGDNRFAGPVGGKVLRIGTMSVDAVYHAVRALISVDHDNEYRRRLLAPELMVTAEVLQAIGASVSDDTVDVTVQKDGKEITTELRAGSFRPWNNHGWPTDREGWINARASAKNPLPLWLQHTHKNYWHTYLTQEKTLYIQYNEVNDEPEGEPISKYFPRILREGEARNVEHVVLDIRLNGGGNNQLNRPIWHALIKSDHLNQKGRLWVLIGPQTFSAAMNLVDDLELNTSALFAGEPTGESPNMWGDPVDIKLPNSGIVIRASTLWWQSQDPRDRRDYRTPDVSVPLSFSAYVNNIDPVMEAIKRH